MKPRKIFTQLGRLGDIINILPLMFREFQQTGIKPILQVQAEFASILEGVSYVEPLVWYGPWDYPFPAMKEARQLSPDVILCQITGAGLMNPRRTHSFAREAWVSAGARIPWGSEALVFDRRDFGREVELILKVLAWPLSQQKKIVLYAGEGKSSPFPYRHQLLSSMREWLGESYHVVDLSQVKAHRFFDLLGLFENAHCLVAIDTAHQHLAAACPTMPVVALCTRDPNPWHGSPWRPEHVARFYYDEMPDQIWDVINAVTNAREPKPRIIHCWCGWRDQEAGIETMRREAVAQMSWPMEYATGRWAPAEMKREDTPRTGKEIGDPHPVPFVRDLVQHGLSKATSDQDIICLTNADIGFTPGLTGRILGVIARHQALWTHRRDHKRVDAPFISEAQVLEGEFYPGTDMVCFTVAWWKEHGHELGDYLMGREGWDEVFRQLIKYHAGGYVEAACWHEAHDSAWCGEGRWIIPGNVHNFRLRDEWFERTGFIQEDFRYFRVVEGGENHPRFLFNQPKPTP